MAGNWIPIGVPTATDNVRINSASVTLAGGTPPYACNNLYIDVPSTLTASANTLNVNGLAFVNGNLTVSGGTVNVNGVPSNITTSLVIAQTGQLNISSGTVNVAATSGDNNRFMSGAGTLNLTGTGILNVNGGLGLNAGVFNMNGTSQLNMNPQGTGLNLVSNSVLNIGISVFVNATGGTITMVNPSANNPSGTNDVFIGGIIEYNNKNFTGSTLRFGNGTANASATISAGGFQASFGSFPTMRMGNLVINNPSGITREVRLTTSAVFNNVTITAGALNLNGFTLNVNGNIVNDGTINTNTSAASTIHFTGSVAQTLSGKGNYTGNVIRNLIVTNFGGGVNLNQNVTVTNQLTLNGGNLTGTGTLTLGNSAISNTLAINRNGGTLGLTPVWNIANPNLVSVNLAYNTPSLSPISYEYPLIPSVAYVAGNELPVTDTLNTLTINAQFGVTFNRSVWARAASPLTLTNGIATFSGVNAFNATLITATLPAPAVTAASWVNGTVSVNINTATNISRSFPVGGSTAGSARTFTINNMQNGGAGITTISVTPVTGVGNTPGAGLTAVSTTRAFNAQVSGFALTAVGTVAINYGLDDNLTTNTALVLAESRIAYSATAPPTSFSSLRAAANTVAGSVTSDAPVTTTLGFFNLGLSTGTTTVVYTGPNNGSWNTPTNWDGGALPTASNDVRIDGNLTVNIPSGSTANARSLIVNRGSTLNDSASTFTVDSNLIVNGTLNIRAGNMLVGGVFSATPNHIDMGAFATINLSGGMLTLGNVGGWANRKMRVVNNFNMTGGNFNLYGQITFAANANPTVVNPPLWTNFTMTSGNFNIYQQGTINLGAVTAFNASVNANLYLNGGTITIVDPNVNATTDINIANNGTRVITGTTLAFGDGVSSLAGNATNLGFSINIAVPFGNVVVNNPAGTNRIVRLAAAATFNNLTVTAGTFNSNALGVTLLGNIVNNGTLNFDNTSIVSFIGTSPQTVSGTGSLTNNRIATLTISNSSDATPGVEFNVNATVTNALNLRLGRLGGTGTLTLGNSVASTAFTLTRTTGSLIVAPTFNFTGVTTTYAYNAPTPAALVITTGLELPAAVNTLTFSNAGIALGSTAFIVGSPVTVNTTLNLSGGIVQTTATNLITLATTVTTPPAGGINAFINGPLAIQLNTGTNTSRTFALGKGTQYRPLTIDAFHSNTTLQTYTAEVITGSTTGSPLAPLNALTSARYWKVLNTSSIFSTTTPTIAITTGADDNIGMPYLARVSQGNFGSSFASRGGSATGFVVTSALAFTGDSIFTIGTEDASLPIIWTGGAGTSNWGDALNWSNNAVPTSSNIVNVAATIAPVGAFPTTINVNVPTANVGTLIVGPNIVLDMRNSTFNVSNKYTQITGAGTVFANGATINMLGGDSFLVAGGIFNGGNSTLNFSSSSLQYIRPTAGTFTFFNMNLTNGDKNFFAGSIYTIGGNLTTDATSTISLSAATNTTFNVGASFTNNATGAGTNVANVIVNMNGLQSVINSPNALSTPSITVANGFLTSLASPITFNTGRTFTVNGRLNAGNNLVNGTGTFLLENTGTLGTTQATGGLAATIDPGLTRTYTLGCQIDYNANGAQVIDALSHNTNCGIRVSNVGTKTLNGNLTIATTGGGIQRGAIYAQNPAVFADGGFVTTITGLTSPSVNVEKGAGYLSSAGGGLTFGPTASTGSIIRVPDETNIGNLELNMTTVSNTVNLQSSEPLLVSNITVNNLNVGVTTPPNGGELNVSNGGTITPLLITGNYTIGNTGATATGTINGAINIYTNITLNGNFSSANTNATQTIIGNTGFNTLIMNGTPGQSFVFSGAAAVSYLAAPGDQGTTGSSIIRINNPANVTFGDGVIRTYTNLGVIELTGNGTVAPTGSTTFAYSNVSGTLRYANSAPITTTDAEYPATNSPFNLQIFATGSGSVTLHAPRVVNGTLFLQSGLVNTTSTNRLSLGSSNSIAGTLARTAGWVNGPLTRWVSSNAIGLRDWTVGTATLFRPASITFNTAPSVGGYVTATYVDGVNSTPLVPTLTDVITLDTRSNAYWQIDTLPAGIGASNYNISLNTSLFNGITDPASVRLIRSDDAGSTFNVTGTHFDGAIGYYNRNVVTNGFGRYYLGANATTNPLPVNLVSLTATVNEEDVVVSWRTASETDNKGFEVERSADGRTFEFAGFVEGVGNSNIATDYALTDEQAFAKTNSAVLYYRLKQIDFDGTVNYSKVIKVSKESDNVNALSAYPNPFASNYQVSFNAKQAGAVTIEMVDIQGKLVLLQTASISKGVNTVTINNVSNLQVGVYFVKATVDGETQVMKLVKN